VEPTYEQLAAENARLRRRVADLEAVNTRLEARVAKLEARIAELTGLLEQRTRDGKRQAAPFSKGEPKPDPRKPGRKPGKDYGTKAVRTVPDRPPDEVIAVPAPKCCPSCGGSVRETHVSEQYQFEIPRTSILRRFDLHVGECACCGKRVQPRHEWQTSDALGAAAVQIGPDAQALIALMKDKFGLSCGRIVELMKDGFGIDLTRGAVEQITCRAAERAEPFYDAARYMVRRSDTVYPDETGWKINGVLHWLHDFVTQYVTLYLIRKSRGADVPAEVLGMDYRGRMTHDGWAPYDRFIDARHQQCLAHLLRRANELIEQQPGRGGRLAKQVKRFLLDALLLRNRRDGRENAPPITAHGLAVARGKLEKRLRKVLALRPRGQADRRFQNHLMKHRDQLLTFLYEENLEATNWPAEQGIRPAVVNRKVCGGNRTPTGAHALEVLATLAATCRRNAVDAIDVLARFLRQPATQAPARLTPG